MAITQTPVTPQPQLIPTNLGALVCRPTGGLTTAYRAQ